MRRVEVQDLKPIESMAHGSPRPYLQRLTDDELLDSVHHPQDGRYLLENTKTGILVDGNGRAHELLRRMNDPRSTILPNTLVIVGQYTPDLTMFFDLD